MKDAHAICTARDVLCFLLQARQHSRSTDNPQSSSIIYNGISVSYANVKIYLDSKKLPQTITYTCVCVALITYPLFDTRSLFFLRQRISSMKVSKRYNKQMNFLVGRNAVIPP